MINDSTTQAQDSQEPQEQQATPKAPKAAKGKGKGKGKGEKPGAWKKDPKLIEKLKKDIPLGSLVQYQGSRVSEHQGRQGVVIGYRDANGPFVDFGKAGRGSISIPKTKVLRKGAKEKAAKESKEVASN